MARVAMYLQDKHEIREGMAYAQYAEQRGFEAVWQAESRLVRDAIVPMAAFAAVTTRVKIGSGVINNWTRNIGLLAATFLTLDDLAPDRPQGGFQEREGFIHVSNVMLAEIYDGGEKKAEKTASKKKK